MECIHIILHIYLRNWTGFPAQGRFKLDSVPENVLLEESVRIKMRSDNPDKKRQKKKKRFSKVDRRVPKILAVWHHLLQFGNLEHITVSGCSQGGSPKWGFVMGSRTRGP